MKMEWSGLGLAKVERGLRTVDTHQFQDDFMQIAKIVMPVFAVVRKENFFFLNRVNYSLWSDGWRCIDHEFDVS